MKRREFITLLGGAAAAATLVDRTTTALLALLLFGTAAPAQPNREQYELQERCGKRAAEFFKREYSSGFKTRDTTTSFNYENHYSARLNKCFFLVIADTYELIEGKPTASKDMRLFDLNENKEYGIYMSSPCDGCVPWPCLVQDQVCRSEKEWRTLIKPFMED
jgi:hypothetical protein